MSDVSYSNVYCDWCNKSIIRKEAKVVNTYTLCGYCAKFPTKECMELWKSMELDWRLLKYIPILTAIQEVSPNNYTIHWRMVYEENPNAREGWVA